MAGADKTLSGRKDSEARLTASLRALVLGLLLSASSLGHAYPAEAGAAKGEPVFVVDSINPGLGSAPASFPRLTPRQTLRSFFRSMERGEADTAAHALDLELIPPEQQQERGAALATMLHDLLRRQISFEWSSLPSTRDATVPQEESLTGKGERGPRRSVLVGSLSLDGRPAELLLERLAPRQPASARAVWLVAPQSVALLPALYQEHRSSPLKDILPEIWRRQLPGGPAWDWLLTGGFALFAILLGWGAQRLFCLIVGRSSPPWAAELVHASARPLAASFALLVFLLLLDNLIVYPAGHAGWLEEAALLLLIAALTWLAGRMVAFSADRLYRYQRERSASTGDLMAEEARASRLTVITIAKRLAVFAVLLLGAYVALRLVGLTGSVSLPLVASAGVVSVVVAIAARPLLGNLLAGLQLASAQPVRVGDQISYEGRWCTVEDITYTFVMLRTWDWRRILVPHSYFLSRPVENWSRNHSELVQTVRIYADYHTDVRTLRAKVRELLERDPDWDRLREPDLLVTALKEDCIEMRALCSARDASTAWYLHCRLREALLEYLRSADQGRSLPRRRLLLEERQE